MKASLLFCAGFIACAGAFLGLWRVGILPNSLLESFRSDATTTVHVINTLATPNGEYVATINKAENAVGWCELRINVNRKNEAVDWEHEYVSLTGCETHLDLHWPDNTHLAIEYWSSNPVKGVHTYQQFLSKDGRVNISYNYKPQQ
jgi:hypothetical protein